MTHRERALAAVQRRQPDRVPLDLGSVGGWMVDGVYHRLRQLLGMDDSVPPYRSGSSANYYDERILERFDIDFRHLWFSSPDKPKRRRMGDGAVLRHCGHGTSRLLLEIGNSNTAASPPAGTRTKHHGMTTETAGS